MSLTSLYDRFDYTAHGCMASREETFSIAQPLTFADTMQAFEERLSDSRQYCLDYFRGLWRQGDFLLPNLKREFVLKYDPKTWSYDLDDNYYTIHDFLYADSGFNDFFYKLADLLYNIQNGLFQSDVTISVDSKYYKKIDELVKILSSNGFENSRSNKLSFWSGREVKEFLLNRYSDDELVDLQIPVYVALFTIARLLDEGEYFLKNPFIIFRRFVCLHIANQAKGDVSVYLSKDEILSDDFLRVGNHFWEFELSVLRQRQLQGVVKRINLIFFTNDKNIWATPIDLDSEEANKLKLVRIIPVEKEITSDKGEIVKKVDYEPQISGNEITLGKLREIINRWRIIAKEKAVKKAF